MSCAEYLQKLLCKHINADSIDVWMHMQHVAL